MSRLSTYEDEISKFGLSCVSIWDRTPSNTDAWGLIVKLSSAECRGKGCNDCSWQKHNITGLLNDLSEPME